MLRRQSPRGGYRPPVRPSVYRRYSGGLRPRKPDWHDALVPLALVGYVIVVATVLIVVVVIRGPDTHSSLWNEVYSGYGRTDIAYVSSLPPPPLTLTPLPPATSEPPPTQMTPANPVPSPSPPPTVSPSSAEISFSRNILPVFKTSCVACHGLAVSIKGVSLTSYQAMTGSQETLFLSGKPEESLLVNVLRGKGLQMPPSGLLPEEKIKAVEEWIRQGGRDN